jgi:FkbM family methyltransferase
LYEIGTNESYGIGAFYEAIIEMLYHKILAHGGNCIDGGANHGRHTFPMSKCLVDSCVVFAFEALPELSEKLESAASTSGRNNVIIINKAITNSTGKCSFNHIVLSPGYSGIKKRAEIDPALLASTCTIEVNCTSIDDEPAIKSTPGKVAFIKLDLEGGELDALRGAKQVIVNDQPFIVFENGRQTSANNYGYTCHEWFEFFESVGYNVYDLFGRPFGKGNWDDPEVPFYFIGVPKSNREWNLYLTGHHVKYIEQLALKILKSNT